MFRHLGRPVVLTVAATVCSHYLLDLPVHPRRLALFPYSDLRIGSDAWNAWGSSPAWPQTYADWWLQAATLGLLLAIYLSLQRRAHLRDRYRAWTCTLLLGSLQLLMLMPCIGY